MSDRGREGIEERVIAQVERTLGRTLARPFPVAQKLSELGVTSMQMVNLMLGVEVEFDLAIPPGDITPENFFSVGSMTTLIARLRSGG